jgi:hypothetical protein
MKFDLNNIQKARKMLVIELINNREHVGNGLDEMQFLCISIDHLDKLMKLITEKTKSL